VDAGQENPLAWALLVGADFPGILQAVAVAGAADCAGGLASGQSVMTF
jgi:hypothetical protein